MREGFTMTEAPEAKGVPTEFRDDRVLAWMGENLADLKRSVIGQRFLYWSLGLGFMVGLAVHVGGYALRSSTTTEPLGLVADLLYALGYALWTGVVVALFVQVIPEAKRRQIKRAIDAYEESQRDKARAEDDQASGQPPR
jgi:hypothetical protein